MSPLSNRSPKDSTLCDVLFCRIALTTSLKWARVNAEYVKTGFQADSTVVPISNGMDFFDLVATDVVPKGGKKSDT